MEMFLTRLSRCQAYKLDKVTNIYKHCVARGIAVQKIAFGSSASSSRPSCEGTPKSQLPCTKEGTPVKERRPRSKDQPKQFHTSHTLVHSAKLSVWYCASCGFYASQDSVKRTIGEVGNKLRWPCIQTTTRSGKKNLNRLRQGLPVGRLPKMKKIHGTHDLDDYHGLLYCKRCCFFKGKLMELLHC